jgi:serine/threonine protein kinase
MGGTHLTATGMVVGTPGYMSPEQAEGHEAGPPSDVFSLACVVAYAASGKQPFGSGSAASVLYRVVATEPDLDGVPPRLLEVLQQCLRKNPAERPPLPAVATAFSRGAGTMGDSALGLTAFWPQEVTDIIQGATADTPGASGRSGASRASGASGASGASRPGSSGSPLSPMPGSLSGVRQPIPQGAQPQAAQPQSGQPQLGQPPWAQPQGGPAYAGQPGAYTGQPGAYTPPPAYPSSYQPPSYHPAPPQPTPPPGTAVPPWPTPGAGPDGRTPPPQAAYGQAAYGQTASGQAAFGQAGYAAQQEPWPASGQHPSGQQPHVQQAPGWQVPSPQGSLPG